MERRKCPSISRGWSFLKGSRDNTQDLCVWDIP